MRPILLDFICRHDGIHVHQADLLAFGYSRLDGSGQSCVDLEYAVVGPLVGVVNECRRQNQGVGEFLVDAVKKVAEAGVGAGPVFALHVPAVVGTDVEEDDVGVHFVTMEC